MTRSVRAAQAACIAIGAVALLAPAVAGAQRRQPRISVVVDPRPATPAVPYSAYPGSNVTIDPRGRAAAAWGGRRGGPGRQAAPQQVVYVPVYVDGWGSPVPPGAYYAPGGYGSVTDVNGRPLSTGFDREPAPTGAGYTPDLTGAPYVVGANGIMIVALPGGERSIPACASRPDNDPNGRPRTVFYQPSEFQLVLREGQAGRVQGPADPGPTACYGLDRYGRVALR